MSEQFTTPGAHEGSLFKKYLIYQGFKFKDFSARLNVSEQMLYKYFKQPDLLTRNIKLVKKLKDLGISKDRILKPEEDSRLIELIKQREEVIRRLESLLELKEEELALKNRELKVYKDKSL